MTRVNGFFGYVKHNDLMSGLMFLGFLAAMQLMAAVMLFIPLTWLDHAHSLFKLGAYAERYVPFILIGSIITFGVLYMTHVNTVRQQMGFRYVEQGENRELATIVETLALTAGIQTPRIGIIETYARNAFACGLDQSDAVVVVTRGLLNALNRDELEAVVAHEITHIVNGDTRLIAAANVMMQCLEFLDAITQKVLRSWWRFLFFPLLPFFLFFSGAMRKASSFALDLGKVSRLVIASSREYIADAEAVRLTHKPEALISALRRIENVSAIDGLAPQNDAMMIDGATIGSYATHPTIAERIAVIAKLAGVGVPLPRDVSQERARASFGNTAPALPQMTSPWHATNLHNNAIAREQAVPKSLIDRVRAGHALSKRELFFKKIKPWAPLIFAVFIFASSTWVGSLFSNGYHNAKQSDGSYMWKGVRLTKAEYDRIQSQVFVVSDFALVGQAPSQLISERPLPTQTNYGLRGFTHSDDKGGQ